MSDIHIATTTDDGLRRLEVHGQPVAAMHRQLAAILGNRLGRQHALLLGRPEIDPAGGSVAWYTSASGDVRRLADLAESERRPVDTLARQLISEIRQLAQKMKQEGDSAELVGHMLELAVLDPADDALYAVGAQPVLVRWGYASTAQVVPDPPRPAHRVVSPAEPPPLPPEVPSALPPEVPPDAPAPAASPGPGAAAPAPAAAGVSVAAMAAPARGRSWLAWLLPLLLLLLLAWLVWRALQPLEPVIVELAAPSPPPAADPVAPEQEKEKELRAELARLTHARDDKLALCKPIPPPPAPAQIEPPEAPKEEPKAAELPPPPKFEPKPKPVPPPLPPVAEVKPKPAPSPPPKVEPKPPAKAPDEQVALAPPPPPPPKAPPRSACQLNVAPGDEPEVVVIVDGSGSMREPFAGASSRMSLAKDALETVVKGLPPEVDVALIDFSDCDRVRLDKFYSSPQRPSLIGEVRALQPDRGTPLARSIERAGNIVSSGIESTIVVVSDGYDTCGRDPCAAARAVKAKRPNVTINVIDVSGGDGRATAQCIASATGGKVLTPNSTLDMKNKVQQATRLPDTRNCQP